MKNADLHTHSYYSADSDISPEQLIIEAKQIGLKHIALTDHDSIEGIDEFLKAGKKHKIDTIPGVEIHSQWGEILGYFVNHKNKDLINLCKNNKKAVHKRTLKTIEKLNQDGFCFDSELMKKKYKKEILERNHIASELVEKGFARTRQEVFNRFLGRGNKYYIKSEFMDTAKVIGIIKKAGGAPVLSHPYVEDYQSEFKNIEKLIEAGLIGIESLSASDEQIPKHYPANTNQITKQIDQIAEKYNLILTIGSDYHGSIIPFCQFGTYKCDESVVIALKKTLGKVK